MKLTVGQTYNIIYHDIHYPCGRFGCQDPNVKMLVPCCHDRSYSGPAICLKVFYKERMAAFAVSPVRAVIINIDGGVFDKSKNKLKIRAKFLNALLRKVDEEWRK